MNRGIFFAALLGLPGPALAQQADVSVYGPMQAASVRQENGSVMRAATQFTLYELNDWTPARAPAPDPPVVSSDDGIDEAMRDALKAMGRPSPASAEPCAGAMPVPVPGISERARISRIAWWKTVRSAECRYGLPAGLMDSVVLAESRYRPDAVSSAGAAGIAQLMPGTARDLGLLDRFDGPGSIDAGARYLRFLMDTFAGSVPLAVAAYNAGPGAVQRARGIPLNRETPAYVQRVLGYWSAMGSPGAVPMSARGLAQLLGFAPRG
ncbi:lytic transglycosylase domain-containing protein [Sphingomonas oryzagri]